jgi:hypothetical protein
MNWWQEPLGDARRLAIIGGIRLLAVLGAGLLGLAVWGLMRPSERASFALFKYASLYMAAAMAIVAATAYS